MRALNIIESVYSGLPYVESEKVLVDPTEVNLAFKFLKSRFSVKTRMGKVVTECYDVDYSKYCELLDRTKLVTGILSGNLTLYSRPEDFEPFIAEYGSSNAVFTEPLNIDDLMYSTNELSPLGIMALLFRKSYGSDRFKKFINSNLLKEYKKIKLSNGPNIYLRPNYDNLLTTVQGLSEYKSWEEIATFLIGVPYIYIWRD